MSNEEVKVLRTAKFDELIDAIDSGKSKEQIIQLKNEFYSLNSQLPLSDRLQETIDLLQKMESDEPLADHNYKNIIDSLSSIKNRL
jgi:uncharacterized protein YerC